MSTSLSTHLEQIALCGQSIAELPFPAPSRFTNAILSNHDITVLLRDTQAHERALFHLAPPELSDGSGRPTTSTIAPSTARRRTTMYGLRAPKNKAVATVLGGDLYSKIQQQPDGRSKGEVDVELLLQGAEKLAAVYPIAGASERIARLRRKHQQLEANIAHYEGRANEQREALNGLNITAAGAFDPDLDEMDVDQEMSKTAKPQNPDQENEDWHTMQDDIRELEQKKLGLERRVQGMEKDLGGLLR